MNDAARITEAEAFHLRHDLGGARGGSGVTEVQVLLVRLASADGCEGWGFSYVLKGPWQSSLAAARDAATALLERPVPHPEAAWRAAVASYNRTGGGANLVGLAAVDVALWDLWARRLGQSIGSLLGGAGEAVPVYASGGFAPGQDPEAAADVARAAAAAGYVGVKPRLSGRFADRRLLREVRAALPDDTLLLADANERLTFDEAMAIASYAPEVRLAYLEEPLPAGDVSGWRRLALHCSVPLAGGEHFQDLGQALPLLRDGIVALAQPDLAMMGGLTPVLAVARAAGLFGVRFSPHFLPGLFVQIAGACPTLAFLEEFPLIEPVFDGWPAVENGRLTAGDGPGHGLVPRADALATLRTAG